MLPPSALVSPAVGAFGSPTSQGGLKQLKEGGAEETPSDAPPAWERWELTGCERTLLQKLIATYA